MAKCSQLSKDWQAHSLISIYPTPRRATPLHSTPLHATHSFPRSLARSLTLPRTRARSHARAHTCALTQSITYLTRTPTHERERARTHTDAHTHSRAHAYADLGRRQGGRLGRAVSATAGRDAAALHDVAATGMEAYRSRHREGGSTGPYQSTNTLPIGLHREHGMVRRSTARHAAVPLRQLPAHARFRTVSAVCATRPPADRGPCRSEPQQHTSLLQRCATLQHRVPTIWIIRTSADTS